MPEVKESIDALIKDMIGGPYHCLGCAIKSYCRTYNWVNYRLNTAPCEEVWKAWVSETSDRVLYNKPKD